MLLFLDKPSKSKFAPVIGGERRKATASTETTIPPSVSSSTATLQPIDLSPVDNLPISPRQVDTTSSLTTRRQTAIETVTARRDRRRSIPTTETPTLSAATLPTVNFTNNGRSRVTMAHFLKDTGTGIPMNTSFTSSRSGSSTPRASSKLPSRPISSIASAIVPQVRIVNGEIIVDDDAPTNTTTLPAVHMDVVHEGGRHLTSHAFVKTIGNNRWNRGDTDLFHEAVSMCGTDFAMISLFFPKRTREQVKGKFKIEERSNPTRLAMSLKRRKPLDVAWLDRAQAEKQEAELELERKPGRPRQQEGIDSLFSSPTKNNNPTTTTIKSSPSKVITKTDVFTSSPRKSPRIASRNNQTRI